MAKEAAGKEKSAKQGKPAKPEKQAQLGEEKSKAKKAPKAAAEKAAEKVAEAPKRKNPSPHRGRRPTFGSRYSRSFTASSSRVAHCATVTVR